MMKRAEGREGNSGNAKVRKRGKTARRKGIRGKPKQKKQAPARVPVYDEARRELVVGKVIVKKLTQRSDAQETILKAFQEDGWLPHIDDPLTGKEGQERKQRLRRAVDNLNRRQRRPLLHFHVIREGTGVAWEYRKGRGRRATVQRR